VSIKFSKVSLGRMDGLHPDLRKVIDKAAELATSEQDFMVVEGLRSKLQMIINYGKGRTAAALIGKGVDPALANKWAAPKAAKVTWLTNPFASKHGPQHDGYGHAVDLAPYPLDWNDRKRFEKLAGLMKQAAAAVNIRIVAGADWKTQDLPHFELA
jgi:peptidoglycan LD-endopeptidase CwlK